MTPPHIQVLRDIRDFAQDNGVENAIVEFAVARLREGWRAGAFSDVQYKEPSEKHTRVAVEQGPAHAPAGYGMAWPEGYETPIHGHGTYDGDTYHPGGCVVLVTEGTVYTQAFDITKTDDPFLVEVKEGPVSEHKTGDIVVVRACPVEMPEGSDEKLFDFHRMITTEGDRIRTIHGYEAPHTECPVLFHREGDLYDVKTLPLWEDVPDLV